MAFLEIIERDLAGPRSRAEAHHALMERLARRRSAEREYVAAKRREDEAIRAKIAEDARLGEDERARLRALLKRRERLPSALAGDCRRGQLSSTARPFSAVTGPSRLPQIVRARHELMYRLSIELHWSLSEIGNRLGRDHTTVLSGIRRHAALSGRPLAPSRPKPELRVIELWKLGGLNTHDIARLLRTRESSVANAIHRWRESNRARSVEIVERAE